MNVVGFMQIDLKGKAMKIKRLHPDAILPHYATEEMRLIKDLGTRPRKNILDKRKDRYGLFECSICKKHFEARTSVVRRVKQNRCKSCASSQTSTTHGKTNTRLFTIWRGIKLRCLNAKNKDYKNYGERCISICDEWKNDFMSFYNWAIENGYKEELSIDRINNDGNYQPNNCRWVTNEIQGRNTRLLISRNKSGYRGVSFSNGIGKWRAAIKVNSRHKHIGNFDSLIEAGYAYDKYVIENNLEHTTNGLYKKEIL